MRPISFSNDYQKVNIVWFDHFCEKIQNALHLPEGWKGRAKLHCFLVHCFSVHLSEVVSEVKYSIWPRRSEMNAAWSLCTSSQNSCRLTACIHSATRGHSRRENPSHSDWKSTVATTESASVSESPQRNFFDSRYRFSNLSRHLESCLMPVSIRASLAASGWSWNCSKTCG